MSTSITCIATKTTMSTTTSTTSYLMPFLDVGLPDRRHSESLEPSNVDLIPPLSKRIHSQSQFTDTKLSSQKMTENPDNPFQNANLNIWESQQQTTPSQQRQLDQPSSPTIEAPPQEESPKQFQHTNPPPSENSLAPNAVDRRGSDASSVSSISDCPTPPKSPELIQVDKHWITPDLLRLNIT